MKKNILFVVLLCLSSSVSAENLLYCLDDDWEKIEPEECERLRSKLPEADRKYIYEQENPKPLELQSISEDLVNCRWGKGGEIPPETCEFLRTKLSVDDQEKINQALVLKAKQAEDARLITCTSIKQRGLSKNEKAVIMASVKSVLKDPDSAKFKWMKLHGSGSSEIYCGLVNAKNSYGGYTGYSIFSVTLGKGKAKYLSLNNEENGDVTDICKTACYDDFTKARP